ncbi:MAG: bifunctional enoyl-CoA hydratase/phosphate acetyltransferase [Clostridia bacterium]|nr:bifunctional enoyl-CoA hydratase/phosphate acetyltransferase [Clostridia bacterium]
MVYRTFDELISKLKSSPRSVRMAVAAAGDDHTIEAVLNARKEGIVSPILVGDKKLIDAALNEFGATVPEEDIYDIPDIAESAKFAVQLVREGKANLLMKGKLDTSVMLRPVVNKETGIGKGGVMSHFTAFEVPNYHKLLVPVDGGMVTYPTLEQKKSIIENTVGALRAMGYDEVKVGVLACVEKVNPKMPETVEADELKQMNLRGEITGCIVEGPISYDCAVSKEIADFKGFHSPVAGDADVLIAPNIHAGNIMGKMLACTAGAKMAGFIVGAKVPIVLTSRGSSPLEKYNSIAIAAAAAE